jgi:hypothetical protein
MTAKFLAQTTGANAALDASKVPPMEMNDEGQHTFDPAIGIMQKLTVTRRMKMGDVLTKLDAWEIRLLSPPKR